MRLGQMFGEPVQGFTSGLARPAQADLSMRPRADSEAYVDATRPQVPELIQRLLEEQVLPSGDQQDGDIDLVERRPQLCRLPVLGGRVRVRDPGLVPRSGLAKQ